MPRQTGRQARSSSCPASNRAAFISSTLKDPLALKMHKVIEPEEIAKKTNLSAPHTVHCLADETIMISMLGDAKGEGPGGFLLLDSDFDVLGRWEKSSDGHELQLRLLVPAAPQRDGLERMVGAEHVHERLQSGGRRRRKIRPSPALLGLESEDDRAIDRPRRRRPHPARSSLRPRPRQELWLRRRRAQQHHLDLS